MVSRLFLQFERDKNLPQADGFEKIAAVCLRPLRLATGHEIVWIKKDGTYAIRSPRKAMLVRIIAALCNAILFPLTGIGLLALQLSATHKEHAKKLKAFLAPPQDRVFQLLKERNLFIKIIGNDRTKEGHCRRELLGDYQWDYLLNELKDPQGTRQQRRAKKAAQDRVKFVYDAEKKALVPHRRENFYQGTNKTSLTLLPANAKTALAVTGAHVGLLFDATQCQAKGKYVFKRDGVSHGKWWRAVYAREDVNKPDFAKVLQERLKQTLNIVDILDPALGSLDKLRQQLAEQEKEESPIKHYNEVLASVKKEAIVGLFCRPPGKPYPGQHADDVEIESLSRRITAISRQAYLKEQLGMHREIYLADADEGLNLYPQGQQQKDLKRVLNSPHLLQKYAALLNNQRLQHNQRVAVNPQELRNRLQELLL